MTTEEKKLKELEKKIEVLQKEKEVALLELEIKKIKKTVVEETTIVRKRIIEEKYPVYPTYPQWTCGDVILCNGVDGATNFSSDAAELKNDC